MATLSIQNASGQATSITPNASNTGTLTLPAGTATILATPLPSGTATAAPLTLTTGTNLTTATAGALEYNGYSPYFTPTGTQRGVIQAAQYYALNTAYTGTQATTAQSIFGLTNGVTLASSTIYEFEMAIALSKSAGTTSHTLSISFGGTATLNSIGYSIIYSGNGSLGYGYYAVTASLAPSSITSASYYLLGLYKGTISVNAGGTFNPQYTLSAAPGGAYSTNPGSYMKISPLAASGSNVSIGAWS
jgi:hypothetical protein